MAEQQIDPSQIKPQDAWSAVTFQNSWIDFGGGYATAAYMKDTLGFVHLKGLTKSGTIGSAIFILPAGYRPLLTLTGAIRSNNTWGIYEISNTGAVVAALGSNVHFSIDGITFKAEA